ncbi:hypothetical protein WMF30_19065 [Sorangium sp. So ce134]
MPLLPGLEFTQQNLRVAYRASADPQEVTIDVVTAAASRSPVAPVILRKLLDAVQRGSAGGHRFPPAAGAAEILDESADRGPSYRWKVRLAAVDPLFLRTMVEELRLSTPGAPTLRMHILGALPLDDSPLSIREDAVKAWLDDPRAYLREWPAPGFPIVDRGDWAMWRVRLHDRITPDVRRKLDLVALGWFNDVWTYVHDTGQPEEQRADQGLPRCGSGKLEFSAAYHRFYFARRPSRARLVNALTRFHQTVAPIAAAEISP